MRRNQKLPHLKVRSWIKAFYTKETATKNKARKAQFFTRTSQLLVSWVVTARW